jgi:hypothetical protein
MRKWDDTAQREEKVNGWRNVPQEEVERRMSRLRRGKVTVGGMTSMARAKTKKNRTKRVTRKSDHGRRSFLWTVLALLLAAPGALENLLKLKSRVGTLPPPVLAPVSVTPLTGTLHIVAGDAVAIGESHVVPFGEDASRASRHPRDVMVV